MQVSRVQNIIFNVVSIHREVRNDRNTNVNWCFSDISDPSKSTLTRSYTIVQKDNTITKQDETANH